MSRGLLTTKMLGVAVAILLGQSVLAQPNVEAVPGEYVVQFKKNASMMSTNQLKAFSGAEEVRIVSSERNIFVIKRNRLEREEYSMQSLAALSNIEIVEPNYIYRKNVIPNDPDLGLLWGMRNFGQEVEKKIGKAGVDIGAEKAWDITTGSKNVVVAVIDTGLDYTHPDLAGNAWVNTAEANGQTGVDDDGNGVIDDIHGYNAINGSGNPMDDHGHGSHCAGTIAATGNDGVGVVGVAWNAQVMGVKFLSAEGSGTLEDAVKAIDYATKMNVDIMSNSWGGGGKSEVLQGSIERARDAGILFVAAAGNSSADIDQNPHYPSSYTVENVLAVAAIDNAGSLAWFSNYGKNSVHVAAPGENIRSTVIGGGYDTWSGTSMATPHVSGVAVLLLANEPNLTFADIKTRLVATSTPLAGVRSKVAAKGLVNAYYALTKTTPPADPNDPYNWETTPAQASTAHPYKESADETYELRKEGASSIAVYFSKFDVENGFDFVEFLDAKGNVVGKWTGRHDDEFSPAVEGDTIRLRFKADHIVNSYGFDVSQIAFK